MNKAYRVIWSSVKEAWVIVAENVRGKGGPPPLTVTALMVAAALALAAGTADALPTGPQVVNGTAGIATSGNTMTITNSANAIINWQGFSIGNGETARFIQPSAVSAVLNRVTGGDPSKILGALQSNGKVLLINPNGILFGPNSRVDVNGLVASTLNISNQDFIAGKMKFSAGTTAGKVENQGSISTPSGGQVYLIAPDVQNSGLITAPNGDVLLAAGKEVLLVDSANPEIAMVVTAPEYQAINLGSLVADAGRVGMYGSVVRQQGRISADSAVKDASGRIFLKATKEVTLEKDSITTATGSTGGNIQILGQRVGLLDNAVVDASGATGGGTVLVGGDYQGKNPLVQNAEVTYMGKDAVIKADATDTGNGGKVILWSDSTTRAYGSISARGGSNGGDGGFVETSGHYLDVNGIRGTTAAPNGKNGLWLLDPNNITIQSSGGDTNVTGSPNFTSTNDNAIITTGTIQGLLNGGSGVSISTASAGANTQAGDITVASPVTWTSTSGLTMTAGHDIIVGADVSSSSTANITLTASNLITLNAPVKTAAGGSVSLNSMGAMTTGASGVVESGSIYLQTTSGYTGSVGTSSANPLKTKSPGGVGMANLTVGSSTPTGPTALYLSHTGEATFSSIKTDATNFPVDITASSSLSFPAISSGTSSLNLKSTTGNLTQTGIISSTGTVGLTAVGNFVPANNIAAGNLTVELTGAGSKFSLPAGMTVGGTTSTTVKADKMDLSAATVNLGAAGSTVTLTPKTAGQTISLGNDNTDADLNLTTNELNKITATTLRVGDNLSGALSIGAAIAPAFITNLVLGSGTTVGQAAAGTITVANLGVKSLGNADLSTALNVISGSVAAGLGNGSNLNSNFRLRNNGNLVVGTVDGIAGISTQIDAAGYSTGSPNGFISLYLPSGALTQTATISGKAVRATAGTVTLTSSNPVGVIAGVATGNFSYTSSNAISLDTVDAVAGVTASAGTVALNGAGIGQNAPVVASALSLTSSSPVSLTSASNNVTSLSGTLTGTASLNLTNSNNLTVNLTGIATSNQAIDLTLPTSGTLTVLGNVTAGSGAVTLQAPSVAISASVTNIAVSGATVTVKATTPTTGSITMSGSTGSPSITATSSAKLEADSMTLPYSVTASSGTVGLTPLTANRPVFIGTPTVGTCFTTPSSCLILSNLPSTGTTPAFVIGSVSGTVSGPLDVAANITRPAGTALGLLSGSTITQSAGSVINTPTLGFHAGGAVSLATGNSIGTIAGSTTVGSISVTNSSGLALGTASGPGYSETGLKSPTSVTVTSSTGSLSDSVASVPSITAPTVSLSADSGIGTSAAPVKTQVSTISASNTTTGGVYVTNTGGAVSVSAISSPADVSLKNSAAITATGTISATGSVSVVATGASSNISLNAMGEITGSNVTLNAGQDVQVTGGTVSAISGTATLVAGRDITVNAASGYDAQISAATDVNLTATTGKLYLTSNGANFAKISANSPLTVYLNVPGQTSGGYKIDTAPEGSTTVSATNPDTGIFVLGAQAVEGTSLIVTRAAPPAPPPPPPPPTIDQCIAAPTLSGCSAVLPALTTCTSAPTTPGCSVVLPSLATCTTAPTTAGCSVVLPSLSICTSTPTTPGCSVVLPSLATCTTAPTTPGCIAVLPSLATCTSATNTPGCSVVLPTLATCTSTPTTPGCTAVLPSLSTCTSAPTTPGCSVVLPSFDICIAASATPGCSVVLPTMSTCISYPTAPGCSVVLPALGTCTVTPTTPGCSVILPTIAACTSNPATPGCSTVLPGLSTCIATPSLPGCSVVLPNLNTCIATPSLPGCSVTLPNLTACIATPSLPGCSVTLPNLTACIATPSLPGCSVVLPSLSTCIATPSLPGCSVTLPNLTACIATPSLPGCSVVLPSLSTCIATPSLPGCSVTLPNLTACITTPSLPGCSVVLPSLSTCIATPSLPGCSVVLPSLSTCVANPTAPGCAAVLPTIAACTANPSTPGCSVMLPSLTSCIAAPTTAGCSVVLPPLNACAANQTLPGCTAVLPGLIDCLDNRSLPGCSAVLPSLSQCTANQVLPGCGPFQEPLNQALNATINLINRGTSTSPTGFVPVNLILAGNVDTGSGDSGGNNSQQPTNQGQGGTQQQGVGGTVGTTRLPLCPIR